MIKVRNKKGLSWIVIGLLLCATALVWIGKNERESSLAGEDSEEILKDLEDEITPVDDEDDTPFFTLVPDMEMPVILKDGHEYIGILEIPSLNLELPIMSEWNYPNLKIAPCRYSGSAYQSNMVIAAHNYQSHFGRLRELNIGDAVTFTDVDGNQFHYTVADLEVLQPNAIDEMVNSDWDLTLFTCTIGGKTRVTVRCESQDDFMKQSFNAASGKQ